MRALFTAIAVAFSMALAGCSFSPVYSDGSPINAMSLAFDLAKPSSRLEQIVYQELSLRFATSTAPKTPKLMATVTASSGDLMLSAGAPGAPDNYRATVTVNVVVLYEDKSIFTARRVASADYKVSGQTLANQSALLDAQERAAKAATESLRLAILAKFPHNGSYMNP